MKDALGNEIGLGDTILFGDRLFKTGRVIAIRHRLHTRYFRETKTETPVSSLLVETRDEFGFFTGRVSLRRTDSVIIKEKAKA